MDGGAWRATVHGSQRVGHDCATSLFHFTSCYMDFLDGASVKNLLASAGDERDMGSIPGLGKPSGEGNGNPLQYSCLENPIDRGVWRAMVHGVAKSRTRLKRLSSTSSIAH